MPQHASASARLALLLLALVDCGSHATIRSAPNFTGAQLRTQNVLVLPIAVSSDFTDDRTGISIDGQTREEATKRACRSGSQIREDVVVTCFDSPAARGASSFSRAILAQFAHDEPIPAGRWRELGKETGAQFAVLFRPENVSVAVHETSTPWLAPAEPGLVNHLVHDAIQGGPYREHGYMVSAVLVDLRTGAIVRAGSQSREAKDENAYNGDFDAATLLHDIMKDLLAGILDD